MNEEQLTCLKNAAEALLEAIDQAEDTGPYVAAIDRAVAKIERAANSLVNVWRSGGRSDPTMPDDAQNRSCHIRRLVK